MPFHKTLLPIIAGAVPFIGPTLLAPLTTSLLNGSQPQITPSIQQVQGQLTSTQPIVAPDPLIWTGVAFIGSDSAQRALASQLIGTAMISPEQVVVLHNNTTKAQFLIDGKRLLLELTTSTAAPVAAPTFAPSPTMAPTLVSSAPLAPAQVFTQPQAQFAAVPQVIAPAVAGGVAVATRSGLVATFGKIISSLGAVTGLKALSTWIRTNPGTAAGIALTLGLTVDEMFDSVGEEALQKSILLTKNDVKGFRRTLRVGKRFSKFTRVRTRIKKVPMVPTCPAKISCG